MSEKMKKWWIGIAVAAGLMVFFPPWREVGRNIRDGSKVIDEPRGYAWILIPPQPRNGRCSVEIGGRRLTIQLIILGLIAVVGHSYIYREELVVTPYPANEREPESIPEPPRQPPTSESTADISRGKPFGMTPEEIGAKYRESIRRVAASRRKAEQDRPAPEPPPASVSVNRETAPRHPPDAHDPASMSMPPARACPRATTQRVPRSKLRVTDAERIDAEYRESVRRVAEARQAAEQNCPAPEPPPASLSTKRETARADATLDQAGQGMADAHDAAPRVARRADASSLNWCGPALEPLLDGDDAVVGYPREWSWQLRLLCVVTWTVGYAAVLVLLGQESFGWNPERGLPTPSRYIALLGLVAYIVAIHKTVNPSVERNTPRPDGKRPSVGPGMRRFLRTFFSLLVILFVVAYLLSLFGFLDEA